MRWVSMTAIAVLRSTACSQPPDAEAIRATLAALGSDRGTGVMARFSDHFTGNIGESDQRKNTAPVCAARSSNVARPRSGRFSCSQLAKNVLQDSAMAEELAFLWRQQQHLDLEYLPASVRRFCSGTRCDLDGLRVETAGPSAVV